MRIEYGNYDSIIEEYGSTDILDSIYGGKDKNAIIDWIKQDLETAHKLKANYVVFHVSEVSPSELYTYQSKYTDDQVIDAVHQLINPILSDKRYNFDFLYENLWWAGFKFTSLDITRKLLDGTNYQKKGLMLDTGHLMNTNININNELEAINYVLEKIKEHESVLEYIKGLHFSKSISGKYVNQIVSNPPPKKSQ